VEPDGDAEHAAEDEADLAARVADGLTVRARRAAGLVGPEQELDVRFAPGREALPVHARFELDRPALPASLRSRRRPVQIEDLVEREPELAGDRVKGPDRRLDLAR